MKGAEVETVFAAIRRTGLVPRGALLLEESERVGELADIRTIVLAGMVGRDGWEAFAASPEASDGLADPLDRWSRRLIEALARELGAQGAVSVWRAALLAVPAMGAARRTRPFLADWPINSSRITACGIPTAARLASLKRSPSPSRRSLRAHANPVRDAGA